MDCMHDSDTNHMQKPLEQSRRCDPESAHSHTAEPNNMNCTPPSLQQNWTASLWTNWAPMFFTSICIHQITSSRTITSSRVQPGHAWPLSITILHAAAWRQSSLTYHMPAFCSDISCTHLPHTLDVLHWRQRLKSCQRLSNSISYSSYRIAELPMPCRT